MEATGTTASLLREVGQLYSSLQDNLNSDEAFQSLAQQLGWDLDEVPVPVAGLLPLLEQLEASVQALVAEATVSTAEAVETDLAAVFAAIKALSTATYAFSFDASTFKAEFPKQLGSFLIINYLATKHPKLYGILQGIGLIDSVFVPADGGRPAFMRKSLNLALLAEVVSDPGALWRAIYGWQGTHFIYDKLVMVVAEMLYRLGWPAYLGEADYGLLASVTPDSLPASLPYISAVGVDIFNTSTSLGSFFLSLGLLPVLDASGGYKGLAITARAAGVTDRKIALNEVYSLLLTGSANLSQGIGVQVIPDQPLSIKGVGGSAGTIQGKLEAALVRTPSKQTGTQALLLSTPGNTQLSYESITWKIGALANNTAADLYTELKINALRFASGPGDNDSFLSRVLENFSFKTDLSVGLSKAKGFYFDSTGSLKTKQIKNISLGPVQVNNVTFLVETVNSFTYLTVVADLVANLGPVRTSLSGVGLKAGLKYDANGGDIGPFSTDIAVKVPTGVGIAIDSDPIKGGGFLYLDPAHHQYAGVAQLTFKETINLSALGLLQTELPGQPGAYSLLLLITAQFAPMQLGLGFTLRGVGGLVGINRAADPNYLRGLVRGGELDKLLFPANVLDNPAGVLAVVDLAFPATGGRYVIGLLGQVGWGTPELISLELALLVELPAPVRLLLLGVLLAQLPTRENTLLQLRADFLGSLDLAAKRVAFDATLSQSYLWKFTLTGDMAFRLFQGNQPVFVLSAGGFHPSFQPPAGAGLPTLRRLTLSLARGEDLRLMLASYFALTANTIQFGAHLDLHYAICRGLHVEGHFGFDVLFQLHPFHLEAHVEAGVAIKHGDTELLSLYLSLSVSGPSPWHVWGEASFRIWFIRIRVDVDATIGSGATAEPALAPPDVATPLRAALRAATSWQVEAPPAPARPGGVVLRPAASAGGGATTAATGPVLLDPRGGLSLRQRVTPLGVTLQQYGSNPLPPVGGQRFDLLGVRLGSAFYPLSDRPAGAGAGSAEAVRDFFAPGQYLRLTDGQKLSRPSFELLAQGLRLRSLAGLVGAAQGATRRVVAYEQLLLDGQATGTASGGTQPSGLVAGGAGTARLSAASFARLAKGGVLGQQVQAQRPAARAPAPVGWAADSYVVVEAATLARYVPAPPPPGPGTAPAGAASPDFGSQLEAEQYVLARQQADPTLTPDALLVVPAYQLLLA